MRFLLVICIFLACFCKAQVQISGITISENNARIPNVEIINITNGQKTSSNSIGEFTISAKVADEIRFVKLAYERTSKKIVTQDFSQNVNVVLTQVPLEIEEVTILNLSGDLNKDSKKLAKKDKIYDLKKNIGLPEPVGKPRETPADLKRDILFPLIFASLDVQAVYDLISGKSRRLKALYKYEDMQDNIIWMKERIPKEYLTEQGVSEEKISEVFEFSLLVSPDIKRSIQTKNISRILLELDKAIVLYKEQSKKDSN